MITQVRQASSKLYVCVDCRLDIVYAVAFSLVLLHTDAHNKNVRQKMNKDTFIMRTKIIEGGEAVPHEILDVSTYNILTYGY